MNILYSSNENYAQISMISIISLLEHNKEFESIDIYYIDGGLLENTKKQLTNLVKLFKRCIHFIDANSLNVSFIKNENNFSIAGYYRLLISNKIAVSKILYLDCDTIVTDSLFDLWNTSLEEYAIAGVVDTVQLYVATSIGMKDNNSYINSGMMLMNLEYWRKHDCENKIINFFCKYKGIVPHHDQGVINGVFNNKIRTIEPKYNAMSQYFIFDRKKLNDIFSINLPYTDEDVLEAIRKPVIVHFLNKFYGRPWNKECTHPFLYKFDSINHKYNIGLKKNSAVLSNKVRLRKFIYKNFPFFIYLHFEKIIDIKRKKAFFSYYSKVENGIKVLLINYGPKPLPAVCGGGVETLIESFYSNCSNNINVTVASCYNKSAKELSDKYSNVSFIYIKTNVLFKVQQIIRYIINKYSKHYIGNAFIYYLNKYTDFNNYDVIISENGVDYGRYLRKKYKGKLVLHLHNDFLNKNIENSILIKESYDQIWTLSKFVYDRVNEVVGKTKVRILYNGVNLSDFSQKSLNEREKNRNIYNISKKDFVFAFCGRFVEEKGILQLIKAFEGVNLKYPNSKLLIIGDYKKKNDYTNLLLEYKSNKNIIFTGQIDHNELPKIMDIADVGIAPTVHLNKFFSKGKYNGFCEGFNLTLIEFMGLGKPVIASNSGGMPELVTDMVGLLVNCNENHLEEELVLSMEKYLKNSISLESNNIIKNAENFSEEKYCRLFESYIGEIYDKN